MSAPTIESIGNRIILHFESLDQALRLFQPWPAEKLRTEAAEKIAKALEAVGLVVEVRVRGRAVAEMGFGALRGSLLSMLGMAPVRAE